MLFCDVREACDPKRTGKGQWTYGFLLELLRHRDDVTLLANRELPATIVHSLRPEHRVRLISVRGFPWHVRVARLLRDVPGATYLSTTSYMLPAFGPKHVRYVTVVHDLIAFRSEPHDWRATLIERMTLGRALRRSASVLCLSAATKRDLASRYGNEVAKRATVVGAGVDAALRPWNPPGKHIFCLATLCPRKNQKRLIEAYRRLPEKIRTRFPLLLAGGRGWHDEEIVHAANATPGVSLLGYVDEMTSMRLLSESAVFAYPSLYEGFGLPVLDALSAGIPVLTSSCGSLAEVAGDAALVVDPLDVSAITRGLQALLEDPSYAATFAARGPAQASTFGWSKTYDAAAPALSIDNLA